MVCSDYTRARDTADEIGRILGRSAEDGHLVSGGVYIAKLQMGETLLTRRLTLLK